MKDNKIIAEFMGFTSEKNIGWYDNNMMMPQSVYDSQDGNCFDDLLFDKSWDWLMPVMAELVKRFGSGWIFEEGYDLNTRYDAVVKFIKQMEYKWKL
tara:strand:+ start:3396 stop:3686 length:291 start_codon:yes stop_codon:yes gene_type:complete